MRTTFKRLASLSPNREVNNMGTYLNIAATTLTLAHLVACDGTTNQTVEPSIPYDQQLYGATTLTVKEANVSWGREYSILVNDTEVARVTGKDWKGFSGDRFTLTTVDGTTDYTVDKKVAFRMGDMYDLIVHDKESTISVTDAILLVCIEDAIGDAHTAVSLSNYDL
jgi:hypothetical protein